jgi:acetoin utilization deacetylase AcuC-like enzyme
MLMSVKIVYNKQFEAKYPTNPVENPDRVRLPSHLLREAGYEFVEPSMASLEDIRRVHGLQHVKIVQDRNIYDAAALASGGAIVAAELAMHGDPTFALIRPPGHHASANRAWGLCFFNNIAIAVQKIRPKAKRVLIIDIDLHFGDGTVSIFRGDEDVKIVNPGAVDPEFSYLQLDSKGYMRQVEEAFDGLDYDIVGVSAGFDTYVEDWGGLLTNDDFFNIGRIIKESSEKHCSGKRFAILEGGYHSDLKYNIKNFIEGFA